MDLPGGFDHPAWISGLAAAIGYGLILLVMCLALFVVPYLAFSWL